jgi:peptidoglycan/xylan/chitin deacetylase (PgdA/CDA1 family)
MQGIARTLLQGADRVGAALARTDRPGPPALRAFMFHHLFENRKEIERGQVDPHQPIDMQDFEVFLEFFLEQGYGFVTTRQVADGLRPDGRYALVTFDDGYASALRAAATLRRYRVPATFFISSSHVASGKAFWWDVLYRERTRQALSPAAIRREKETLLRRRSRDAEAYVKAEFGEQALSVTAGDAGRPMSPRELSELAEDPLVTLGNHTADHAILTALPDDEVEQQIGECQAYLAGVTGSAPDAIAYPNGNHSPRIVRIARASHIRVGMTAAPRRNRLPLGPGAEMALGRYCLDGDSPVIEQCRTCSSDIQLLYAARRLRRAMS